jgi:hypothetical protein
MDDMRAYMVPHDKMGDFLARELIKVVDLDSKSEMRRIEFGGFLHYRIEGVSLYLEKNALRGMTKVYSDDDKLEKMSDLMEPYRLDLAVPEKVMSG